MVSTFRNIIEFFDKIGIYDVILPFLLVFTIVFAILEKTKIFGTEDIKGVKYTKKNLNSMAAFTIAFMTIASSKLVELITDVSSQIVILLLLGVFFLLLVGAFFKEGEGVFLEGGWKITFMVIMFVGILGIFLQAIQTKHGEPWLEWFWDYIVHHWTSTGVGSIILALFAVGIMMYLVRGNTPSAKKTEEESKEEKKD